MPAVSNVTPTGNDYTDGTLTGLKYVTTSLTFSFPAANFYGVGYGSDATNMVECTAAQKACTIDLLQNHLAKICPFTFTEVTESSSVHGDLRYAMSSSPAGGANVPSTPDISSSPRAGDTFIPTNGLYDTPVANDNAWNTFAHEIGHGLGLKHAFEESVAPGGTFPIYPNADESIANTIMSYDSWAPDQGAGFNNETYGFPPCFMVSDIAGLQHMYGAVDAISDNITWAVNATTGVISRNGVAWITPGANVVFATLLPIRTTGVVTLDLSGYSANLTVDLRAGIEYGIVLAATQLAVLDTVDPHTASRSLYIAHGVDNLHLPTRLICGTGTDAITGNSLENTIVLSGNRSAYVVAGSGPYTVTGTPEGVKTITNIEKVEFADGTFTIGELLGTSTRTLELHW